MAQVEVTKGVATVALTLTEDEALYVAAILGNGSQFHSSLREWFPLPGRDNEDEGEYPETVWDTLVNALEAAGIKRWQNRLYNAATVQVSFTPPRP